MHDERSDRDVVAADEPPDDVQARADRDQTHADTDQTSSDGDQTAADSDQAAADTDQRASDRDFEAGGDPRVHDMTRDLRDHGAEQRRHAAAIRIEAAAERDAVATERDRAAAERDHAADLYDLELAGRDELLAGDELAGEGSEVLKRAATNRGRDAENRATAAEARRRAAAERLQAASDRERAARDRSQAQEDRAALLRQLAIAETDALTGARARGPGLIDLEHEIDRSRRTLGRLAVAFVDVVDLKSVNDTDGHAAGDALLQRVVGALRGQLRSYDLIVRLGGDEFLCVMSGATIEDTKQRIGAVQAVLAGGPPGARIRAGFAALVPEDTASELIGRADRELPLGR